MTGEVGLVIRLLIDVFFSYGVGGTNWDYAIYDGTTTTLWDFGSGAFRP